MSEPPTNCYPFFTETYYKADYGGTNGMKGVRDRVCTVCGTDDWFWNCHDTGVCKDLTIKNGFNAPGTFPGDGTGGGQCSITSKEQYWEKCSWDGYFDGSDTIFLTETTRDAVNTNIGQNCNSGHKNVCCKWQGPWRQA